MPIYEYECEACGRKFEMVQKFSDEPLSNCIHCSGKVNKLISKSAFLLKGSGWYATDYAGKEKKCNAPDKSKKQESDSSEKKPSCDTCPAAQTNQS